MSRWAWFLSMLSTRLWIRASIFGVLAVITALISIYVRHYIPDDIPAKIGADAVDGILAILASSMLSVTIFSVSTMVSAYSAATNNGTPRATRLLIEDKVSQNALSTFIGAFIFSMVGIVALKTGAYGNAGRLVLFVVTIVVIVAIVAALLRWIAYLTQLGRVSETVERVEEAATSALADRMAHPYLGGTPLLHLGDLPEERIPIYRDTVGYVQHVDLGMLQDFAEAAGGRVYLAAAPGNLVHPRRPLAWLCGIEDEDQQKRAGDAFIIDRERSFRQDPRYGLIVLSEIATRALSPAVNDPGTAIHVIGVGLRVLLLWRDRKEGGADEPIYPAVHVQGLAVADLFEDFFQPIARDGAAILEVGISLQRAFEALVASGDGDLATAARSHAQRAVERAEAGLTLASDVTALRAASAAP